MSTWKDFLIFPIKSSSQKVRNVLLYVSKTTQIHLISRISFPGIDRLDRWNAVLKALLKTFAKLRNLLSQTRKMYWIFFFLKILFLKNFFFWTCGRKIWHPWQKFRLKSRAISAALPTKMIFLSQKQFLAKNFPWTRRMQFWWPFPFFASSPIIMSWKSEMMGKTFFSQKYFSATSFLWSRSLNVISSKSDIEGIFFPIKENSPKHPRNFWWHSRKEQYDKCFEKRFFPILSSGHERFSFNNPTEKVLPLHPHFPSLGMRGCEAQIPNRFFTQKPPFVLEVVQFSFEFFSSESVL